MANDTPLDLIAAGGAPPESPSLLGSMGGMGAGIPTSLLATLAGGTGGGNLGVIAQALAGGVAAGRGHPSPVTPILEQGARQHAQTLGTILGIVREQRQAEHAQRLVAEKEADRRFKEKNRQEDAAIQIEKDLIASGDPLAVFTGWMNRDKRMAQTGGPRISPDLLGRLARGRIDPEAIKGAAQLAAAGATSEEILGVYGTKGITADSLPLIEKVSKDPKYQQLIGIDPHAQDKWDITVEDHKLKLDQFRIGEERWKAEMAMKERQFGEAQLQHERQFALGERRAAQADARIEQGNQRLDAMLKKVDTKKERQEATFAALEDALATARWRAKNLDAKGYLPKTAAGIPAGILTGDPSAARASMNQNMFPHDDDWEAWQRLNAAVIGLDRVVLQDIGPRAKVFFDKQMQMFSHPGTLSSINQNLDQFEKFLNDAKAGKLAETETVIIRLPNGKRQEGTWKRGTPLDLPPGAIIETVR